ncbi:MAG: glycosyltransferase [Candidatus Omnitrophica bacterium]|nr:glycosyltransferase [Candidatus Omnitrophota bacterium]MDD5553533.1 glycosyltransferase [Candidatus Omnitrophota bacterium]
MQKIKVLRIIARLNVGGPAIHTILLTEGLDKSRFQSLLICGSVGEGEGDMSDYAARKNVTPILIPELKRQLSLRDDLTAFFKLFNIIRRERPDIIHTHTAKAGALGRLAGILYNFLNLGKRRARLLHTFHGHIFEGYFDKIRTIFFIFIERSLAVFTDKIITVSESVKRELAGLRVCGPGKISVIPLGLELEEFFRVKEAGGSACQEIGIVGRLVPVKNHRLFLDAAARVIAGNPEARLRFKIIGDGEMRAELEKYSEELDIRDSVIFTGWQKDLAAVYSGLHIVALTSLNEGTPVSLIEAMACARPVVATDAGGVRDLLGNGAGAVYNEAGFSILERGILVRQQDAGAFASALIIMLENAALKKKTAENAREFVKNKFLKTRLISDMEQTYSALFPAQKTRS